MRPLPGWRRAGGTRLGASSQSTVPGNDGPATRAIIPILDGLSGFEAPDDAPDWVLTETESILETDPLGRAASDFF